MICRSKKTNKQKITEEKCQSKPENIVAIDSEALTAFSKENVQYGAKRPRMIIIIKNNKKDNYLETNVTYL